MSRRYAVLALILGLALVAAAIGVAGASEGQRSVDGTISNAKSTHEHHQHGTLEGHLPATSDNVTLVSKLRLKNVDPDNIADVGVWNNHAYLAAWGGAECKYNGVHVVDISDATKPKAVAFIQAKEGSAPGEGIQALPIDTPAFKGDILVSNNELRWRVADFALLGRQSSLVLSSFFDAGRVWSDGIEMASALEELHTGFGGGARLGFGPSFVIALDVGHSSQSAAPIYIGLGYLF